MAPFRTAEPVAVRGPNLAGGSLAVGPDRELHLQGAVERVEDVELIRRETRRSDGDDKRPVQHAIRTSLIGERLLQRCHVVDHGRLARAEDSDRA